MNHFPTLLLSINDNFREDCMPEHAQRIYMIVSPNNALVASHLTPSAFAEHHTIGSVKHFTGS
jgi:hypothetical protein